MILEIVGQIIFEIAAALGWESLKDAVSREREATPWLANVGHFLMGVIAGLLSLVVLGTRVTQRAVFPGISLVLSPLVCGLVMHYLGKFWEARAQDRPVLFTFRAGAIFAFGMALVRFLYFEWHST